MNKKFNNICFVSVFIAIILLTTGILKLLFPPLRDPLLYQSVGVMEGVLGTALFTNAKSWRIWVIISLFLSILLGFSLYAALFGLPCSCMGSVVHLPRGASLIINGLMLLGAFLVLKKHPTRSFRLRHLLWFALTFVLVGFIASILYFNV